MASLLLACGVLVWQLFDTVIKKEFTEKKLLKMGTELLRAHEKRLALENKIYSANISAQKVRKNLKESKKMIGTLSKKLEQMSNIGTQLSDEIIIQKIDLEKELLHWQNERNELLKQLEDANTSKITLSKELDGIKALRETRIVRIRLKNGSSIIGQLIDFSSERVDIKLGMGSIGIERVMIAEIKEATPGEKIDIQKEWQRQEEEAKKDEENYEKYIEEQKAKGLVYFNGEWLSNTEALKIQEILKKKEAEVFELIAQQKTQSVSSEKKMGILETIFQQKEKPIISIKDNRLYVNGRLFFIKGIGYGIEYPGTKGSMDTYKSVPKGLFEKDFRMMKEAGINTIRTYEPLPPKLLDIAEENQIMVIENICYPCDNTDFNSRVHLEILKDQIRKYVSRDKNRKCILMWSIWNDAPWAWGAGGNVVKRYGFNKVNNFLRELYNAAKQYDISHPVIASNAIDLEGERLGWDFLDIIGLNLYIGGFDWFIEKDAQKNIARIKQIESEYKKPVAVLETGFSTYITGQKQEEVLEKQIKMAGTNVCGITIFQWADGWQKAGNKDKQDEHIEEHWGILDGYRNPKEGYKTVRKLFNLISTESMGYSEDEIIKN
jgi:small nuclear ribonucleoprotein (snRNP)-like protein